MNNTDDISDALLTINDCLVAIGKRLEALETRVQEIPTPEKTYYKPKGYEDYLNTKGNYDEIYRRIEQLEGKVNGM